MSTSTKTTNDLNDEFRAASERVRELQEYAATLKSELQGVVAKVEQKVEIFKEGVTSKIALILNLLSKKQSHIKNTLDNCYNVIDNLVETFLNIGYELENDIARITLKVNDFDSEIKKIANSNEKITDDSTQWFVNCEGRLTKRKNIVLSSILPRFKCGDRKMRLSFVRYLEDVFSAFQVPNNVWVSLASGQLTGMAHDWWNMHDENMSWRQFTKCFIDWTFSDNVIRRRINEPIKRHNNEIKMPEKNDLSKQALSEQNINQRRINFIGNSFSNYSFAVQEPLKIDETMKTSDKDKSGEISGTDSSISSYIPYKKKRHPYFDNITKHKRKNPVNRQQSKNFGLKSAFSTRKIYTVKKRKI